METTIYDRKAMFFETSEDKVMCTLCPHYCVLEEMQYGKCNVRQNINQELITHNYGLISGISIDPMTKKPLIKFMEGANILSIGSVGCNMHCKFCQNSDISKEFRSDIEYKKLTPGEIVKLTIDNGLKSIAYTYNEPSVYYEMVYDTAKLAHENNLKNVLVTNGFINRKPFELLSPYIDAMNIDVKTYDPELYKDICGGRLNPVLDTIALALEKGIHIELTCLIVPQLFVDKGRIDEFFKELHDIAGDVVIHISRYFPRYLHDEAATDIKAMLEIQTIALKYFSIVKLGNV